MTANELLMQFQADVLGVPVIRPVVTETTALGAAFAAGLAVGFWSGRRSCASAGREDRRWEPRMDAADREREYARWKKAVTRAPSTGSSRSSQRVRSASAHDRARHHIKSKSRAIKFSKW